MAGSERAFRDLIRTGDHLRDPELFWVLLIEHQKHAAIEIERAREELEHVKELLMKLLNTALDETRFITFAAGDRCVDESVHPGVICDLGTLLIAFALGAFANAGDLNAGHREREQRKDQRERNAGECRGPVWHVCETGKGQLHDDGVKRRTDSGLDAREGCDDGDRQKDRRVRDGTDDLHQAKHHRDREHPAFGAKTCSFAVFLGDRSAVNPASEDRSPPEEDESVLKR